MSNIPSLRTPNARLPQNNDKKPKPKKDPEQYQRPENPVSKYGRGFTDFIKNAFSGVPTRLNNVSTSTLKAVGDIPVVGLTAAKTEVPRAIEGAINTISLGAWNKLKEQAGHKNFYHLSLIATLQDGQKILCEKNEVIEIQYLNKSKSVNNKTQYLSIPYNGGLTLNQIINKTKQAIGDKAFYDYQGLRNNCQNFILNLLKFGCGINIKWVNDWIYQDVAMIRDNLPGHVEGIMDKVTGLASIGSRLVGKGKKKPTKKETTELQKYMKEKNITKQDLINLLNNEKFLAFIKDNNFMWL